MNKMQWKKIKLLYYPYKLAKKIVYRAIYRVQYACSLFFIKKNKKRVQKKIENGEVLNVIFVVQYIPGWNKLEPIYSKMKENARFNPIIVCVPLDIVDHKLKGNKINDTYQFFISHGYEAIDAIHGCGDWLDLKKLYPDYLFHSRPYNAFMPKPYTSSHIVKYALIANVLYGATLTKNGLDVVIGENYFKNVYSYFAFDIGEKKFYENRFKHGISTGVQRCFPFGAIGMEQIMHAKVEMRRSRFRITVLWTPRWSTDSYIGGSNFFNYKDVIIRLAKDHTDILFIFRPHPLMFGNFINTGEMTEKDVEEFKEYCNLGENIILDESKEYADKFWNSDFLISDVSGIVPEFFITKKPIMYCHTNTKFEFVDYAADMIRTCYEVRNSDDLVRYFTTLVSGNDYKKNERLACITQHFAGVQNNSSNILEELYKI